LTRRHRRRALLVAAYLTAAPPATAAERDGVTLPDRLEAAGTTLTLNGIATRTYSLLRIRVYVAALYLERPSHDATAVLASLGPKAILVRYLQPVKRDDAVAAWRHYLDANCRAPACRLSADTLARFEAELGSGAQRRHAAVRVHVRTGRDRGRRVRQDRGRHHHGRGVRRVLLATWIGEVPTSER
jgi:hypothetical protein